MKYATGCVNASRRERWWGMGQPTGGEWAKSMENPEEKDVPSNSCSTDQKHAPPMQEARTGVGEA